MTDRLLCISYRFPPETYPLAIRVQKMLESLSAKWEIDVITAADNPWETEKINAHHVPPWKPERLRKILHRLRLHDLLIWPDPFVFWVPPALSKARQLLKSRQYEAVLVFMMPYSQGIVGVLLKKWSKRPLILNLNDSPTCSDMNASFPSWLHYLLAHWMEDWYVQNADAVIYVSKRNMERVRDRQPPSHHQKFHLIRRSASVPKRSSQIEPDTSKSDTFKIVYTGGMGGWYWFAGRSSSPSFLRSIKRKVDSWLRYRVTSLDGRSHSPVYVGQAIRKVLDQHPEWAGRIQFDLIGNRVPLSIVNRVLDKFDLKGVVNVYDPVSHAEAVRRAAEASLLFMALPDRVDGSSGGAYPRKHTNIL